MNVHDWLGVAGALIVSVGAIYYLYDIIWGETRPHRVTWAVWTCIGLLGFGVTDEAGAGPGAYVAGVYTVAYVVTFLLSLTRKYGKSGVRASDLALCVVALAGVGLWRFGGLNDAAAAALAIGCDMAAVWPTLRESWLQPGTESVPTWTADVVGTALGLAAVNGASFAANAYPTYLLVANALVLATLLAGRAHVRAGRREAAEEESVNPATIG
jgi:hypothetical protein